MYCDTFFFSWGHSTFLKRRGTEKGEGLFIRERDETPWLTMSFPRLIAMAKNLAKCNNNNNGKKFNQEGKVCSDFHCSFSNSRRHAAISDVF